MDTRFQAALQVQQQACAKLGSPFMVALMAALGAVWPVTGALGKVVQDWPGAIGPSGASLPLRIAAGLHALVRQGAAPDLAQVYPPHPVDEARLAGAVARALTFHDTALCAWIMQPPQTNEVGRSVVLLAAAAAVTARFGLPLRLSELGASAGLNLWFDRYALRVGEGSWGDAGSTVQLQPAWKGRLPPQRDIRVADRRGVDLAPIDPKGDADRLIAFVWPDQKARLARLQAAIGLAESGTVDRGDAGDWLEERLATRWAGQAHVVYHTVAHQYFPDQTKAQIARAMAKAGAQATRDAPLVWLGMEADGAGEGAGLTMQVWPGGPLRRLGRAQFHGEWVQWQTG
ncbi:MAG: DUF2332 family protein [Rhodobacteraceae bacterium]|jgi:hypothetical protein|nr:DUF2332 family protein [Paracoccaceae bacterium]